MKLFDWFRTPQPPPPQDPGPTRPEDIERRAAAWDQEKHG
jgi:hypothetical protein